MRKREKMRGMGKSESRASTSCKRIVGILEYTHICCKKNAWHRPEIATICFLYIYVGNTHSPPHTSMNPLFFSHLPVKHEHLIKMILLDFECSVFLRHQLVCFTSSTNSKAICSIDNDHGV